MAHIVLIGGSPSETSRGSAVITQLQSIIDAEGHTTTRIEAREIAPEALVHAQFEHPDIQKVYSDLEAADGVIIVSPVYKASYSGLLKSLLDLLARDALANKAVLPIVTGGTHAHVLVIDYALRPVLRALEAGTILPGRFILDAYVEKEGENIGVADPAEWAWVSTQLRLLLKEAANYERFALPKAS